MNQQKVKTIIDYFADKMLSFGCRLLDEEHQFFGKPSPVICLIADEGSSEEDGESGEIWVDHYRGHFKTTRGEVKNNYKILGHPVRIGDVLEKVECRECLKGFSAPEGMGYKPCPECDDNG